MRYNINTLSFLIGTFKDIITTFGKNSKSVEFYKRQVNGLLTIGQLDFKSVEFIEELIGMRNTNAVKWESAERKIEEFVFAMNQVGGFEQSETIVYALKEMQEKGKIKQDTVDVVKKAYGINSKTIKQTKRKEFGTLESNYIQPEEPNLTPEEIKIDNIKRSIIEENKNLRILINNYSLAYIKVDNLDRVCSGDPPYYLAKVCEVLDKKTVLRMLSQGAVAEVCTEERSSDPCYRRATFSVITKATELLNSVPWSKVYSDRYLR